jgi:putative FmdB family regulatory protein
VPTYQYACTDCGDRSEVVQRFTDDPLTVCSACGGKLRKVFSPVGIVFKGSGFYRTDSRKGATTVGAGKDGAANDGAAKDGAAKDGATSGSSADGAAGTSSSGSAKNGSASSSESSGSKAASAPGGDKKSSVGAKSGS